MKTIISQVPPRNSFFRGEKTLEIGYPWLSFGAIIALEGIINKQLRVLEFGSGGSTIFWAKNCKSVKSFETNPVWFKAVNEKIKEFNNVELKLANETEILEAIRGDADRYYDIVLVDSYPGDVKRILLANAVLPKIKANGYLILDNYGKFGMENFVYPKCEIYTFDEFGYSGRGTRICQIP